MPTSKAPPDAETPLEGNESERPALNSLEDIGNYLKGLIPEEKEVTARREFLNEAIGGYLASLNIKDPDLDTTKLSGRNAVRIIGSDSRVEEYATCYTDETTSLLFSAGKFSTDSGGLIYFVDGKGELRFASNSDESTRDLTDAGFSDADQYSVLNHIQLDSFTPERGGFPAEMGLLLSVLSKSTMTDAELVTSLHGISLSDKLCKEILDCGANLNLDRYKGPHNEDLSNRLLLVLSEVANNPNVNVEISEQSAFDKVEISFGDIATTLFVNKIATVRGIDSFENPLHKYFVINLGNNSRIDKIRQPQTNGVKITNIVNSSPNN